MATKTEKYKKIFLAEAEEKIAALNTAFLGLEKEPNSSKCAEEAMRASHTLKSSAAAMNFMEISHLAHAMEDVFEQVRSKGQTLAPRSIEVLFKSVDKLSEALSVIKKGAEEPSTAELIEQLRGSAHGSSTQIKTQIRVGSAVIAPIEAIKVDVATLDKLMNLTEELLVEKMKLSELVRSTEGGKMQENLKSDLPAKALASAGILNLQSVSDAFDRLISELQLNVTDARMVPLGQIFERFPRMIRDLAHEQNKEVDFQIEGQDIELDRTVIDRLGEPLIHLLRNAVDHGVEKTGKIKLTATQERDKVIIEVTNEGRAIDWQKVVEVALARGIIDKGTRDKYVKDIGNWKLEIGNLLYQVSTKEKVTETSGRGVGLSIVKSVIESLGGKVSVESNVKGQMSNVGGTKFILSLPLTLAIIQALLVRVSDQIFALPFVQIDRSVRVSKQSIKKAFDQEIAVVEDEDIPMVRLDKLFAIGKKRVGLFLSDEEMEQRKTAQQAELMVITKRENLVGVMIDELLSTQDIVVKPFKGMLRQTKGFAGITLLGDGKPAMILDVPTLLERLKLKD